MVEFYFIFVSAVCVCVYIVCTYMCVLTHKCAYEHFVKPCIECKANGMRINIEKTEAMVFGRERQNLNIMKDNSAIKQVAEFQYL